MFSAPLLPLLVAILIAPLLASLGLWQLSRAAEREALIAAAEQATTGPLQSLSGEALRGANARYLHLRQRGLFDAEHQFLLDNRVHQGRAGYEVLTPLVLDDGARLLVNRGWVPVGASRDEKPDVALAVTGTVDVIGVGSLPAQRFALGDALNAGDYWPRVLQFEDFPAIGEALGAEVLPRMLHPDEDTDWTLTRIWQAVEQDPSTNYGYAAQWFALTAAWLVLVGWLCIRRRNEETP